MTYSRQKPASSVACHEAGHSVLMEHLGLPVERVSIVPEDDIAGTATFAKRSPASLGGEVDLLIRQAVIDAAGKAAERFFGHEPQPRLRSRCNDGTLVDDASFAKTVALLSVHDSERKPLAAWLRRRAEASVAALAEEIFAVACALDKRKTLERAELLELLPSLGADGLSLFGMRSFTAPAEPVSDPERSRPKLLGRLLEKVIN